jgi:hypothetical protein
MKKWLLSEIASAKEDLAAIDKRRVNSQHLEYDYLVARIATLKDCLYEWVKNGEDKVVISGKAIGTEIKLHPNNRLK